MATIDSVALNFASGPTANQKKVTVGYTFNFTAADVGKKFRVGISLYGDDTGESTRPTLLKPALYTFHFGLFFVQKDYFIVTPTAAGALSGTKEATVTTDVLDEDPGTTEVTLPGGKKIKLPRPDEIYASVWMVPVGDEQSARSETKTLRI